MTIKYDFIQSNYYLVKEKKKIPKPCLPYRPDLEMVGS